MSFSMAMMMKPPAFITPEDFTINFGTVGAPLADNEYRMSGNLQYNVTGKTHMNFGVGSGLDDVLIMVPYNQSIGVSTGIVGSSTYYKYDIPLQNFMFLPTAGLTELGPIPSLPACKLKRITDAVNTAEWFSEASNTLNSRAPSYFASVGFDVKTFSLGINISDIIAKGGFIDGSNVLSAKFFFLACGTGWANVTSITIV